MCKNRLLTSDVSPSQPRFRLIYRKTKEGELAITFDIAPTSQPNSFKTYVSGAARRK